MPFEGDLTVDASGSTFDFQYMACLDSNGTMVTDADAPTDALTLIDLPGNTDYWCIFEGADGVSSGTFALSIACTSDAPTQSPTAGPTDDPTPDPTRSPSVDPTTMPTAAPTPQQCEFQPSATFAYQFVILVDTSCGLSDDQCRVQKEQVGDLLLMIKVDGPLYSSKVAIIEFGDHGADIRVGFKDSLQENKNAFYEYVTNGNALQCGDGGDGHTDLVSGIDAALVHFKENERRDEETECTIRKVFVVSYGENNVQDTDSLLCVTLHNALEFTFDDPIDRVLINVPGAHAPNSLSDPATYLECFVAPRSGVPTGAICAASETPWFDEQCVDDGICSEIKRIVPDPTVSPTLDPSADPTESPTTDPTLEPSTDPSSQPSADPTASPSSQPTGSPTEDPTGSPTTPAPTHPGELTCGSTATGDYSGPSVEFEVRMPFDGDLTVDALASTFIFGNMVCFDSDGVEITDVVVATHRLTLIDVPANTDYSCLFEGADGVSSGTFSLTIACTSDAPTRLPSRSPSTDPTESPTIDPTLEPSTDPTSQPSSGPTVSPSSQPTESPTTPAPTHPGELICGSQTTGDYNGESVEFEVRMPFEGDLTIDASASTFNFKYMVCSDTNGVITDVDVAANALTLIDVPANTDYSCIFEGANGVNSGTFALSIACTSDAPTRSPSRSPSADPTESPTSNPTALPSPSPSVDPTQPPSLDPTRKPTPSPVPQQCEFRPSGAQSFQFAIMMDNSCGLTEAECVIQREQVADLLLMIKVDNPPYYTNVTYIEYGEDGAEIQVSLDDEFQSNITSFYEFLLDNAGCGAGGNGQTDLVSGFEVAMAEFARNDNGTSICRKIFAINNCENTARNESTLCDELYDAMDFTFDQPIDRVMINVPSSPLISPNHITDPEKYLECLVKPRNGAATGAICAGNTDHHVAHDDFAKALDEECLDDGICSEIKRIIPDPTKAPTDQPTAQPTDEPTESPTRSPSADPTTSPSSDPTGSPTEDPTSSPTTPAISDCVWESSGDWSACSFFFLSNGSQSSECAQYRERECRCPDNDNDVDDDGIEAECEGSSVEVRECSIQCKAEWTEWSAWSECVILSFDCIEDTTAQGVCSGFRFRTRSCYRETTLNTCLCDDDEFGSETSQTEECSTRNCLQIKFNDNGEEDCLPTWSLEVVNDVWVGNHVVQRGGYMGEECVVVEEGVEYLLVIEDGCGMVSWSYQGQPQGEHTFLHDDEFKDKSFQIVVQEQQTNANNGGASTADQNAFPESIQGIGAF